MQTYSHYIITATLNRVWKQKVDATGSLQLAGLTLPPLKRIPLMVGSIIPDLPLILLAIGCIVYDLSTGAEFGPEIEGSKSMTAWLFREAFFQDWWVKSLHNLFHGPLMVLSYMVIGYWVWRYGRQWGASLFWLAIASLIHTAIDIPLHYDDGPLLLFPFDLNLRFYSPISYWDPTRFGTIFAYLEHIFVLVLLIYLLVGWWQRRQSQRVMIESSP